MQYYLLVFQNNVSKTLAYTLTVKDEIWKKTTNLTALVEYTIELLETTTNNELHP